MEWPDQPLIPLPSGLRMIAELLAERAWRRWPNQLFLEAFVVVEEDIRLGLAAVILTCSIGLMRLDL